MNTPETPIVPASEVTGSASSAPLLPSLYDFGPAELAVAFKDLGLERYRVQQVMRWLYQRFPASFDTMSDLSKDLRGILAQHFRLERLEIATKLKSRDGSTKYLFRLDDGLHIESVVMPMESHTTICMSTQVGCKMGCTFCVTGKMGFKRQLRPAEIVLQFLEAKADGHNISNIVLMGMGEPLDNWENLAPALDALIHPQGAEVTERRITLSTVGLAPKLPAVLERFPRMGIAVSLVAADQASRQELLPVAKRFPLEDLFEILRKLPLASRQRITFEYALLPGVNDRAKDANGITRLLHGLKGKLNIIPFNPDPKLPFTRPTEEAVNRFAGMLSGKGVLVTVRWSRALDIQGACGQLADRATATGSA